MTEETIEAILDKIMRGAAGELVTIGANALQEWRVHCRGTNAIVVQVYEALDNAINNGYPHDYSLSAREQVDEILDMSGLDCMDYDDGEELMFFAKEGVHHWRLAHPLGNAITDCPHGNPAFDVPRVVFSNPEPTLEVVSYDPGLVGEAQEFIVNFLKKRDTHMSRYFSIELWELITAKALVDESYCAHFHDWCMRGGTLTLKDTLVAPFANYHFPEAKATLDMLGKTYSGPYPFADAWMGIDTAHTYWRGYLTLKEHGHV